MAESPIVVTVQDVETGDVEMSRLPLHDYFLLVTGDCHVDSVQTYKNGTHVITIKGRKPS